MPNPHYVLPMPLGKFRTSGSMNTGMAIGYKHNDPEGRVFSLQKTKVALDRGEVVGMYYSGSTKFVTNVFASSTVYQGLGVCQASATPAGGYCWIQTEGYGRERCLVSGTMSNGSIMAFTKTGLASPAAVTGDSHRSIGVAFAAKSGSYLLAGTYRLGRAW